MDHGFLKWKEQRKIQNKKRLLFVAKGSLFIFVISLVVFLFGYDSSLTMQDKLTEFFPGVIGLFLIVFIFSIVRYRNIKFVPLCDSCGKEIHDVKKDCVPIKIDYLGTIDKTVYENKKATIKGKNSISSWWLFDA